MRTTLTEIENFLREGRHKIKAYSMDTLNSANDLGISDIFEVKELILDDNCQSLNLSEIFSECSSTTASPPATSVKEICSDNESKENNDIVILPHRCRKTSLPHKSPECGLDAYPGVVLKFANDKVYITSKPTDYPTFSRYKSRVHIGKRHRSKCQSYYPSPYIFSESMKRKYQNEYLKSEFTFPSSDHLYNEFTNIEGQCFWGNGFSSSSFFSRAINNLHKREYQTNEHNFDSVSDEFEEGLVVGIGGIGSPRSSSVDSLCSSPKQKKKKKHGNKRIRSKTKSSGEKICSSCSTTQTPIWREVKESWGDNWQEILLCNACGLQWRMCGLRCIDCRYVPRASEKRSKKCTRCENGKWYRKV
jgi:hypothetical protein